MNTKDFLTPRKFTLIISLIFVIVGVFVLPIYSVTYCSPKDVPIGSIQPECIMPEYPTIFNLMSGKSYMWGPPKLIFGSYLMIMSYLLAIYIISCTVNYFKNK